MWLEALRTLKVMVDVWPLSGPLRLLCALLVRYRYGVFLLDGMRALFLRLRGACYALYH